MTETGTKQSGRREGSAEGRSPSGSSEATPYVGPPREDNYTQEEKEKLGKVYAIVLEALDERIKHGQQRVRLRDNGRV